MENKDKLYLHINVVMDRDTDKQEYFWNKISSYLESMGMECLGSSEYQPLERIPEETKESNSTPLEPLQNGEREEIWKNLRDIIIQRPPNYILPSYVEVSEERIMDYIMDLLSQAKKEGEEKEKAETKKKIEELFHFYIPYGLYTGSESSWMYTQFGEAIVEEFLRNKEKLV